MNEVHRSLTYDLGQIVFLRTDEEQLPRMVTGWLIRPAGTQYELSQGVRTSYHLEIEISADKDQGLSLGLNLN